MPSAKPHLRAGRKAIQAGRPAEAIAHLGRALAVDPSNLAVVAELGHAFHAAAQPVNALKAFDRVIAGGKAGAATWLATGECLQAVSEHVQAQDAFEKCLQVAPESAAAHHGLAEATYALGQVDRAAQHLARAIELDPRPASFASRATLIPSAPAASHANILEARRALADHLATNSPLAGQPRPDPYANPLPRIGYLSSHFHGENYMKPVWALLNHHDRSRFSIHLFSDSADASPQFAGYHAHDLDQIHHVHDLSNGDLASLIREQQIDLLVDLSAYSTLGRLELFLSPVAPVVAAWFNHYATSGFPGIDVLIGDEETIHPEEEKHYSERVLRLPLSYLTFQVTHPCPPVADPPSLSGEPFTFGSLATLYKINELVIAAWAAMLRGAPDSRLVLSNRSLASPQNAGWIREQFAGHGIAPTRLQFLPPSGHSEFLRYYDQIDLALDTFPYNGGTTTMEAIWQGVPVLTFDGDRWASRTSQTILRRTHLGEFVAASAEDMVTKAIALATNPESPKELATLRREMRERLTVSSACDGRMLALGMEKLFSELLPR